MYSTVWVLDPLRKSIHLNHPFQVAPVHLGVRVAPPIWDFTIGWSYTFQGCASNFLDCFFLDHSPCPQIDVDVEDVPQSVLDPNRWKDKHAYMQDDADWFKNAVGL